MAQQKEKRGSRVVAGGRIGEMGWCMRCGVGLEQPQPLPVYLAAALMKAFADHHAKCPDIGYREPVPKTPIEWMRSRDVGVSSGTIFCAATGRSWSLYPNTKHFDVPHDVEDFGRCYLLLQLFPEMRAAIALTVNLCPKWKPFVEAWDELWELYEIAMKAGDNVPATKLQERIRQLEKAAA